MIPRLFLFLSRWVYHVFGLRHFGGHLRPFDDLLTCFTMYIYPLTRKVAVHCCWMSVSAQSVASPALTRFEELFV
ncbi:hypothetical protein FKP32DRAFT_344165 [Trametes sanguinea]|nr:hypothetical protein FKP32DRAFT_344165 [Trametes sanguinea]